MKHFIVLLFVVLPLSASAAEGAKNHIINQVWAAMLASKLSKIEKPQDFVEQLPLTDRDIGLIQQEINSGRMKNFSRPKITMPGDTKVVMTMGKQTAEMDFKEFHLGRLYVNKTKIAFQKDMDYLRFRFLVERAMQRKTALLNLLMPDAEAQVTGPTPLIDFLTGATASSYKMGTVLSMNPDVPGSEVQKALEQTYAETAKFFRDLAKKNKKPVSFNTLQFKCDSSNHVSDIYDGDLIRSGKSVDPEKADAKIHYYSATGKGSLSLPDCPPKEVDRDGKVAPSSPSGNCMSDGSTEIEALNKFKPIAETCCQDKDGCAQKIASTLKNLKTELMGGGGPATAPSGALPDHN